MKNLFLAIATVTFYVVPAPQAWSYELTDQFSISGFVDAAYYNNADTKESTFSLDQAEIDIEKTIEGVGGLRVDIQSVRGDEPTTDNMLEQGYIWADFGPVTFTFGKFNAPIGWELLDPIDMYQYSHAMVFNFGIPTNVTGAMLSGDYGYVDYALYVVNGWDLIADDNEEKTIGGRLGITPTEGMNIGLSVISGKEGAEDPKTLSVFDIDATLELIENLIIGAEFNSGSFEGQSAITAGDDSTWTGFLVTANYAFTDKFALTLRYDQFHDAEGERFGNGLDETQQAITISPSYMIADGFGGLLEYRHSSSDHDTFANSDGSVSDTMSEVAVEFIYSF